MQSVKRSWKGIPEELCSILSGNSFAQNIIIELQFHNSSRNVPKDEWNANKTSEIELLRSFSRSQLFIIINVMTQFFHLLPMNAKMIRFQFPSCNRRGIFIRKYFFTRTELFPSDCCFWRDVSISCLSISLSRIPSLHSLRPFMQL
jgi:hypothetical protein